MISITIGDWMALVNRIDSLEAKLKELERQQAENYDDLMQKIPVMTEDGRLEAQVFAAEDGYETVNLQFSRTA